MRETSLGLLTGYLGLIVDAMVASAGRCPAAMRLAFRRLQQRVEERFPGAEHQVTSGPGAAGWTPALFCLRWAGPGALGPHDSSDDNSSSNNGNNGHGSSPAAQRFPRARSCWEPFLPSFTNLHTHPVRWMPGLYPFYREEN